MLSAMPTVEAPLEGGWLSALGGLGLEGQDARAVDEGGGVVEVGGAAHERGQERSQER